MSTLLTREVPQIRWVYGEVPGTYLTGSKYILEDSKRLKTTIVVDYSHEKQFKRESVCVCRKVYTRVCVYSLGCPVESEL